MTAALVRLSERRGIRIAMSTGLAAFAGVAGGAALHPAIGRLGSKAAILPIVAGLAWWLINRPIACVTTAIVCIVLFEDDPRGFLALATKRWYHPVLGGFLEPTDLLLGLALVAVTVSLHDRPERWRGMGMFTVPLALLTAAAIFGTVTGVFAGAASNLIISGLRVLAYAIVVPILVVQVVTTEQRARRAVGLVVTLASIKAVVGVAGWLLGQGRLVGTEVLTYYSPAPNLVLMLFVVGVLASVVTRVAIPRLVVFSAAIAAVTLTLSFRRSFWIATAVAAVLAVIVASGRRGRLIVVASGALLAGALWVMVAAGGATNDQGNAGLERVRSLNPQRIELNTDDRYRLDEQANVYEEIRRHPLTGLGLGMPWQARHPLSMEFPGNRNYTHTTVLWYWLKLGPLGLFAYFTLQATGVAVGYRVWRRATTDVIRVAALALAASVVGLVLAETTGSFTGVEARVTIVIAAAYGWLAACNANATPNSEGWPLTAPDG